MACCRVHDTIEAKLPIVDVDGIYVYQKLHRSTNDHSLSSLPLPSLPLNGWECVTSDNVATISTKVLPVTAGIQMVCVFVCMNQ